MNKQLKSIRLLIVFLIVYQTTFAQKERIPLEQVLHAIEKQFNINFSYANEDIKAFTLNYKSKKKLSDALYSIKKQVPLKFNRISNNLITVTKLKPTDRDFGLQKLEEVIISNYLTSGIYKNNTGSVTIKPNKFGILPGLIEPDVLQSIQALPGILSVDETVSNINIRGGTHDQNLILYDGIKMYQSGHFFGLVSVFNPYLTKTISIYKNGTSAKYGDGVSSVIDMELSDNLSQESKTGFGVNLINVDGFTVLPLSKKTELQITARRSITDFIDTPTYKQYFERVFQDSDLTNENDTSISKNETFYFYDVALKFLYDITKKDKLRVNFINIYNALNYEEASVINSINESSESELKQQNLGTGVSYEHLWNSKLNTIVRVYYSNYDLDATNYDISNDQRLIQENKVIDTGIKLEGNYTINSSMSINTGFQFSEVGISNLEDVNSPLFRSYIKRVLKTYSGYAEANFLSKNKNTLLKVGLRNNYFSKFNTHILEPRFQLSQAFLNDFRLEISGEYKSQTTSQVIDLQNDFLGIEKRRWVLANNSNIPIIKSKQISLGFTYTKNNLLISAEGYFKKVNNITTRSQGFQNQYQLVNATGEYNIKGLDFLIKKQFNNNFSTWLSYSYSSNQYLFNTLNNGKKFSNNFDVRHIINFASIYNINKLKLALGVNWHSGKPFTKPNSNEPIFDNSINYQTPNSSQLNDYLRVDFSTTYTFKMRGNQAEMGVSIWNLLDKKNIINTYYSLNNETVSKIDNTSLGLTPNISFRLKF
ncbi:TonB-dependent receptor plug domain-containing protein [Lacinutrix jangbogonensis]|uniref:TonB-dependent receptor plug domain-containing protein n=1 Tax=Lacinutrix jangbogonensis TaxID=1469557 RepID=UPI00053EDEB9|nr:TonB-dependent receptor plug domain-containing protein [Lacinutrix jangbogonensis]